MEDWISAIASVVTATIAFAALVLAIKQLNSSKLSQKEATAKAIYKEYLRMCFENPKYAYPVDNEILPEDKKFNKYTWFVSNMLFSCEEIYQLFPNDKNWIDAIEAQFEFHKTYLNSEPFKKSGELETYCEGFKKLLNRKIET